MENANKCYSLAEWCQLEIECHRQINRSKAAEAKASGNEEKRHRQNESILIPSKSHFDEAVSLNNLGELYRDQGKYAEAEFLYKRALIIWEKAYGSDDLNVATVLENMAKLYTTTGREDKAEKLQARARKIRSRLKE